MKLSDLMFYAPFARDLGIALVCFFFSAQAIIGVLISFRKMIQKYLFIRSEKKSNGKKKNNKS